MPLFHIKEHPANFKQQHSDDILNKNNYYYYVKLATELVVDQNQFSQFWPWPKLHWSTCTEAEQ